LLSKDGKAPIRPGAHLALEPSAPPPVPTLGHVTSADFSPMLDQPIALALIEGGLARKGETLHALDPLRGNLIQVVVTDPVFFDPEGTRLHG
jgi:glycine cleavage system aminomethyltransferase T